MENSRPEKVCSILGILCSAGFVAVTYFFYYLLVLYSTQALLPRLAILNAILVFYNNGF